MNNFRGEFTFDSRKAKVIEDSIKLEASAEDYERSKASLKTEEGKLILEIEASDLHALRASVNTYMKWLIMAEKLAD